MNNKERGLKFELEAQKPKWVTKGKKKKNCVLKRSQVVRSIFEKERET
jgi:hypothetical protein